MKPDPRPRRDGTCRVCRKPRHHHRVQDGSDTFMDPFCSSGCCRAWHGVGYRTVDGRPEDGRA